MRPVLKLFSDWDKSTLKPGRQYFTPLQIRFFK